MTSISKDVYIAKLDDIVIDTIPAQNAKFSINDFFSKCHQILIKMILDEKLEF